MAEQTHNRDMSDEPDRQDLQDRVEQLESTISKMLPGRRDALKLGGAALVGGAAMSGAASAQPGDDDGEAGVIGTDNKPVDIEASDIEVDDLVVNQTVTGPFGIVFEEGDSVQEFSTNKVTVAGKSYSTIFSLTNAVDVYGGAVYGFIPSQFRVTFATGTTATVGAQDFAQGRTLSGDQFTVLSVIPMKNVEKLEFFNSNPNSSDYGFQVFTT